MLNQLASVLLYRRTTMYKPNLTRVGLAFRMTFGLIAGLLSLPHILLSAEPPDQVVFPVNISSEDGARLAPIMAAYRDQRWDDAIRETIALRSRLERGPLDETAAFFLGDLYARRAEAGDQADLRRALQAFEAARQAYPKTDNATRALWRIGQIYGAMDLGQEAVASLKRVAGNHPDSRYAIWAFFDLADLYRSWEQWQEADEIYRTLRRLNLSPAERTRAAYGSAEILSRLGRPEDAYHIYRESEPGIRGDAAVLFRYAESAYRAGHYDHARNLFLTFFNIYPKDPLAPVAYAFVADTLRIDKRTRNAELAYDEILGRPAASISEQLGMLMAMMGKRQLLGCAPLPSPADQAPCRIHDAPALNPLPVARTLAVRARDVFLEQPSDPTLRRLIFNIATLLRDHGLVDDALELHYAIVAGLRPSPMRERMSAILRDTAENALLSHIRSHDDLGALRVFYRFRAAFPAAAMNDRIGLLIAESHARLGLLAQAIELSGPIAANRPKYQAEEALYLLAESHRRRGEWERAQRRFGQYLTRYPGSAHGIDAIHHLVTTLGQQGQLQDAAGRYQAWMARYGRQPASAVVSRRLASLLGDAFYLDRHFSDAVRHYQVALADAATDEDRAWAQLQLGKSYAASGRRAQGVAALKSVALDPNASLPARVAALHLQELEGEP